MSDAQWARIEHFLPGKLDDRGRSGSDNRLFVDAIFFARARGIAMAGLAARVGSLENGPRRLSPLVSYGSLRVPFQSLKPRPSL
ncbi:transposase [Yoonia sp. SDW83-1]|uniref:transposase n=1 Tax=Yoonia sp. SDW83-1 TaxID=3366945 RepID=UPI00398C531A